MTDRPSDQPSGDRERFFDRYPRFYETAGTGGEPNRLHERYRVLIEDNREAIEGKRVLDIASHDGRWTFAALMNGAEHVWAIEGRHELVEAMRCTFDEYGIRPERYRVEAGDVMALMPTVEPGSVDTVFLFGFFYHTMHHMRLLNEIARIAPAQLIIDTRVAVRAQRAIIVLSEEDPAHLGTALAEARGSATALVGNPSRGALRLLLEHAGYSYEYYDWHQRGITNWTGLKDYAAGWRVSLRATPRQLEPSIATSKLATDQPSTSTRLRPTARRSAMITNSSTKARRWPVSWWRDRTRPK